MFPDDHPLALGAVGFMRHDYVNFGFDRADLIVAVGYELREFDPVRVNPRGDTKIIHLHRFPAEVDAHYDVAVGLHSDIGRSLAALADALGPDFVAYAESFGATGYRISSAGELLPTLRTALAADPVSVIACPVDYSANLELIESLGDLDDSLS